MWRFSEAIPGAEPNHMNVLSSVLLIGMGGAAIAPPTSLVEKDKERKYTKIQFPKTCQRCLFLTRPSLQLSHPAVLPVLRGRRPCSSSLLVGEAAIRLCLASLF